MANMVDYLAWRGDLSLDVSPWNEVDALLMANLCYLDFRDVDRDGGLTLAEAKRMDRLLDGTNPLQQNRRKQFETMAETTRFGGVRMHHYIALTDPAQNLQFSATCYDLPDGTLCVAFRGTDGTFVGWKEDFNMSFQPTVPAHEAAMFYLRKASELDGRHIRLTGHSKGGNLAVYAAACSDHALQNRIVEIHTFDGPGMDPEVFQSEGYRRILGKIRSFVPQTSIVGMMMEYHRVYTVVRSSASGISQHDPLTWQVYGPRFETMEKIDENAEVISDTLHEWLEKTDRSEREQMVDAVFGVLENTKATSVSEMMGERLRSLTGMALGAKELNPESRKSVMRLVGLMLTLGFGNLTERYLQKRQEAKAEAAENRQARQEKPQEAPGGAEKPEKNGNKA